VSPSHLESAGAQRAGLLLVQSGGDHHGRGFAFVYCIVDRDPGTKELPAQNRPERCPRAHDRVRDYTQSTLEPLRRFGDHGRVDPDPGRNGESAPRIKPSEVDQDVVAVDEGRDGARDRERNSEGAREEARARRLEDGDAVILDAAPIFETFLIDVSLAVPRAGSPAGFAAADAVLCELRALILARTASSDA
jgi:hypothetical protein